MGHLAGRIDAVVISGPFDTINGLPLHPLIVHVVVVLLPLSALGALLIACVPKWSRTYGPLVIIGAAVSTVSAWIAQESGLALARKVGVPAKHLEYGSQVKFFALALLIGVVALWILDRRTDSRGLVVKLVAVAVVVIAAVATWWTFVAGDTGAQAVWG